MWNTSNQSSSLFRILSFAFVIIVGTISILASGGGGDDDNGSNGTTHDISGYIQKGPFISGSSVMIYELDPDLNQTGVSYQTQTVDDFGSFELPDRVSSDYVEIISTGFYFNEVEGNLSSATLTLNTISKVTDGKDIFVNILTCLASNRIRYLVQNENKSFENAQSQAENELLAIFNISEIDVLDFDQMNISEEGNSNAILLAVSAILQGSNTVPELTELISKISLDIEEDGTLDNATYSDEIINNSMTLILGKIRTNLENRYTSLGLTVTIPNFEDYIYGRPELFTSHLTFNTGDGPFQVELGDLDRDGDLDLVVSNSLSHTISIHFNPGDGTFANAVTYQGGGNIAIGDLNGDEYPDIVLTESPTLSVILNNGDGTLATAVPYSMSAMASFSSIGDLDGDGDLDIVTVDGFIGFSIYLNNGNGTFANPVLYPYGIDALAIGDLDLDGDLDIAGPDIDSNNVAVLLNNGKGTFAIGASYPTTTPYSISSIVTGDFDGDGDLDLVVTNTEPNTLLFLCNNGNGTFAQGVAYSIGSSLITLKAGDFDEDGDLDLITTNNAPDTFSVIFNNGNGTFSFPVPYEIGYYICGLAIGDVDGDGDLDLVATDYETDRFFVLFNNMND